MIRNGGLIAAVDAIEGEQLYRERTSGGGGYTASPVLANGHLYLASERGQISVVKAGKTFAEVHFHELGEPIKVAPAIDENTIYFRAESCLWAFRRP
jgi:outer membrane protein assembly factor BamB